MPYETQQHLYAPPQYKVDGAEWHPSYSSAFSASPDTLTWDLSAILSANSWGYITGQRTLFCEITRQPWMSQIDPDGKIQLADIPVHGYYHLPADQIASRFIELVTQEAKLVCQNHKQVYVLLSGGLDSRIVAGILAKLKESGEIAADIVALVWGQLGSRDVVYSQKVSRLLDMEWFHINLEPEDLMENITITAQHLASSVSPIDVHRIPWFKNTNRDALVLAASYGDSVGRAEYSGSHLLELRGIQLVNSLGLLKPGVVALAKQGIQEDRQALFDRTPGVPKYVLFEHEMQGQYMRGQIAHAMALVNKYCSVYQMFTHPMVYSYMWSIHPAFRVNQVYAEVLKQLHPQLLQLPWARTNRALRGKTIGRESPLTSGFHDYPAWVAGPLNSYLSNIVDPEWFEATGIFCGEKITELAQGIRQGFGNTRYTCSRFLWLASFRLFVEHVETQGKKLAIPEISGAEQLAKQVQLAHTPRFHRIKTYMPENVKYNLKVIRKSIKRVQSLRKSPVEDGPPPVSF